MVRTLAYGSFLMLCVIACDNELRGRVSADASEADETDSLADASGLSEDDVSDVSAAGDTANSEDVGEEPADIVAPEDANGVVTDARAVDSTELAGDGGAEPQDVAAAMDAVTSDADGAGPVDAASSDNVDTVDAIDGAQDIAVSIDAATDTAAPLDAASDTGMPPDDVIDPVDDVGLDDVGSAEDVATVDAGISDDDVDESNADVAPASDAGSVEEGPVIDGCEPTGPGEYIHKIEFVPADPDDCTETVAIVHGVHPGLGYGFGTTNTGKCQPPFNCGPIESKITLSLLASKNGDNPDGPEFAHTVQLKLLKAYDYCVVGEYTAPNGISETIQSTISVTACD